MARHREKPFVAYYACPLVHIPTVTTPLSPDKNAPEREQFAGMVRYMDAQVGRLVAELERLGLRDNTIIIFLHRQRHARKLSGTVGGKQAAGGLGTLSENGLDVPLIVNCPARVAAGRVSKALVDCSDFFPTLLELAGVPMPRGLAIDGKSFAAQLDAKRRAAAGTRVDLRAIRGRARGARSAVQALRRAGVLRRGGGPAGEKRSRGQRGPRGRRGEAAVATARSPACPPMRSWASSSAAARPSTRRKAKARPVRNPKALPNRNEETAASSFHGGADAPRR